MLSKEATRLSVLTKLSTRTITQPQAAAELGLSVRQVKRLLRAFRERGSAALVSTKRGKPPNNRLGPEIEATILEKYRGPYKNFGPRFVSEKLAQLDGIFISDESVRRLLMRENLWKAKRRRRNLHPLRKRRSRFGELIQADGSPHAWFEERGPSCTLMLTIDDATSRIGNGFFADTETTLGYFQLMYDYLQLYGRPEALYTDRHSIFRANGETTNKKDETSFGSALTKLGVELICANSPQAKGRVERANRTLQDRLVNELRLRNISTQQEANAYLPTFIADHNTRFACEPEDPEDAHAPIIGMNIDDAFVCTYERRLDRNLCLQFENRYYRLIDDYSRRCLGKGVPIIIERRRDGNLRMRDSKRDVLFEFIENKKVQGTVMDAKELAAYRNIPKAPRVGHKPAANHPWKGKFAKPVPTEFPQAV